MRTGRDDDVRSTKPVRIPSLPPRTAPQPIVSPPRDDDPESDDSRAGR